MCVNLLRYELFVVFQKTLVNQMVSASMLYIWQSVTMSLDGCRLGFDLLHSLLFDKNVK